MLSSRATPSFQASPSRKAPNKHYKTTSQRTNIYLCAIWHKDRGLIAYRMNIKLFLTTIIFADIEPFSGFSMWVTTVKPAFHTGLFTLYPCRGTLSAKIFITFFII